jgi:small redox-active disulfide protein 2
MKIIVAGPGCARCHATEKNVIEAAKALNLQADISHEFDVKTFRTLGVKVTPAVLVDGQIVVSGHIPTVDELKGLLAAANR